MFNTLEFLPIDTDLLNLDYRSDTELAIEVKQQLAFVHHCVTCERRFSNLSTLSLNTMRQASNDQEMLNAFTIIALCRVLTISTLHDKGNVTPFYRNIVNRQGRDKILPTKQTLREITYGVRLSWGAMYGSLGYNLFFGSPIHYATPSQLLRAANLVFISRLGSKNIDTPLEPLLYDFNQLVNNPEPQADITIYKYPYYLLDALDHVAPLLKHLEFLNKWLPIVHNLYLQFIETDSTPNLNGVQDERAYSTIKRVAQLTFKYGYDFTNPLIYNCVYHQLPEAWGAFYSDLVITLKQTPYDLSQVELRGSFASEYLVPALRVIPVHSDPDLYRYAASQLLNDLGCFDLLLLSLAGELITRANILTHPTNDAELKRPLGLLHLASLLLKRSSIQVIRDLGVACAKVSGSPYQYPLITDLLVY